MAMAEFKNVNITYINKGAECAITLPDKFVIPFYGSTMHIHIIHSSEHGTAFISRIDGVNKKDRPLKRHFITNEVFVQSYAKYAITRDKIIMGKDVRI
jgi:hypothetical protein